MHLPEARGEGWTQLAELAIAFVLSALIGLEREYRQKSAGLRTYTVVGVAAALIVLVSKYGFTDVLETGRIVLDPSRVAAQIVSGIGFIGGGVIFMRRDLVRGLTTAAIVWLTAAVGMACGAGLPVLAVAVTAGHFIVVFVFPSLARKLPHAGPATIDVHLLYEPGKGVLRRVLARCTQRGFSVSELGEGSAQEREGITSVMVSLLGRANAGALIEQLGALEGVVSVQASDSTDDLETASA